MRIIIINGPNLNLLGTREPDLYGQETMDHCLASLRKRFPQVEIEYYQSNHEGALVDRLQETGFTHDGIILNAAAYTHTSIALLDAIRAISAPVVEVHLSNVAAREDCRNDRGVRHGRLSTGRRSAALFHPPPPIESVMTEQLQRYIEQHSDPEGDYLHRLWRATHLHTLHGRMVSGHVEGRLLKMLVTMIRPKHILEIGTFTGYSALCMAEGLRSIGDGGIIHTFDVNDELEPFTRQWIDGSGLGNYIDFRIGDAIEQAPQLGVTFDLAFIDGDKRTYLQTYEMVLPLLRQGGFILADNTLWDGHVVDSAYAKDQQTLGICRFNDATAQDQRIEKVILPMRDGLTLMRKL